MVKQPLLPNPLKQNAPSCLDTLSEEKTPTNSAASPLQTDLFSAGNHPVVEKLGEINPDELSPKSALDLLYSLKKLLN